MNLIPWLIRAARLARHPPSPMRVRLVLITVAASLAIAGIGHFVGWPAWLTPDALRLKP